MIYYKIRYPLGLLKKRVIEYWRRLNLQKTYEALPNNSLARLLEMKNQHAGEDCFIVGNGPSLKEMDLHRLQGKHCIFFNGAFDLREYTTPDKRIHVCEDRLVLEDHQAALNALPGPVFLPSDLQHLVSTSNPIVTEFQRGYPENRDDWPPFVDCDSTTPIFYWGGTVAYLGVQLAQWMGFKNIYIIGVDLTYTIPDTVEQKGAVLTSTEEDPNHYKSSYFGKGLRWHVPQPERMLRAFGNIAKNPKISQNIYNSGVGGNLNCFERVNFDDVT